MTRATLACLAYPALIASAVSIGVAGAGCLWRPGEHAAAPWLGDQGRGEPLTLPDESAEAQSAPQGESQDTVSAATRNERLKEALRNGDSWIRGVPGQSHRWRYPNLEDMLGMPADERPDPRSALGDDDAVVAGNAAIGLARLGDPAGRQVLAWTVRNTDLRIEMRCAAAEALAGPTEPSPLAILRELADRYGGAEARRSPRYSSELHAELLCGLARHVDAAEDPRFAEALAGVSAEVKLAALEAWQAGRGGALPKGGIHWRNEADPRVRAAAVTVLARRGGREALDDVKTALNDPQMIVRQAAIRGLGEIGGDEAEAMLRRLAEDPAAPMRAAAVPALAMLGREPEVLDAADDKSWQVRLEVARALAAFADRQAAAKAQDLLDDTSAAVGEQAVLAVSQWPLAAAGPLLLEAMSKQAHVTRRTAAERLAAAWPPAAGFPVDAPAGQRANAIDALQRRFRQEVGFADEAALARAQITRPRRPLAPEILAEVERRLKDMSDPSLPNSARAEAEEALTAHGANLVDALEELALDRKERLPEAVYREVLPACGAEFAALDRLSSAEVGVRRQAAEDLAEIAGKGRLGRLARERLAQLAAAQTDSLVWLELLAVVAEDATEPSMRLAYAAASQPAPEVRLRACEYLAAHPDPRHMPVLVALIDDGNLSVARVAVRAIGLSGNGSVDAAPLKRLLASPREHLRAEAALALALLRDPSGPDALERLAYSTDDTVRLQVAVAMGQLADSAFTPTLIRFLDDRQSIRRAALDSLPRVVGQDMASWESGIGSQELGVGNRESLDSTRRIELWKRWFAAERTADARSR